MSGTLRVKIGHQRSVCLTRVIRWLGAGLRPCGVTGSWTWNREGGQYLQLGLLGKLWWLSLQRDSLTDGCSKRWPCVSSHPDVGTCIKQRMDSGQGAQNHGEAQGIWTPTEGLALRVIACQLRSLLEFPASVSPGTTAVVITYKGQVTLLGDRRK